MPIYVDPTGGGGGGGGGLTYKGSWDADTNTPTLGDSGAGGVSGDYYIVSVAGATSLDGESDWQIGDWVVNNGSVWQKIDNTDIVTSVFSRSGAVTAQLSDYDASQVDNDSTVTGATVKDALETLESAGADHVTGPVSAVDDGIPTFDSTTGKLIKDSGAKIETGAVGGSILNMTPFVTIDHPTPADGDTWLFEAAGALFFKARYNGTTYAVELGAE